MAPCRRFKMHDGYRYAQPILHLLVLATAAALTAVSSPLPAQSNYPNRVVRIIVPTSPGGANDTIARLIAQGLSERLGRQVVVENRPGAGTTIGGDFVANSPDEFAALLRAETVKWARVAKAAGITPE